MLLHFLLGVLIVVGVSLTLIILVQKSEGGALGMGGGGGQFMSARGASDLLTRTTQVLAALFFILSLVITILTGRSTGTAAAISDLNVEDLDTSAATQPAPAGGITAPPATVGGPLGLGAPAPTPQTAPVLPGLGSIPAQAPVPATPAPAAPAP
jgi:preprotein translocase subunit SecG